MENRTRIRKYLGRKTCLSFCQCELIWKPLMVTYRSIVSFSLIPTFPTSSLSTETGSCRQQGEVLQLYVVSNSKVSLSRLVGIASGRSSLRACRVVICITLPPLRWLTEQKNPKSLRSLQNAQRDTTNLAVINLAGFSIKDSWTRNRVWKGLYVIRDSAETELVIREYRENPAAIREFCIGCAGFSLTCSPWFVISTDKIPWIPWSQRPHWLG